MFIKWVGIFVFLALVATTNVDSRAVLRGEKNEYPTSVVKHSLERVFKALEKMLVFYKRQYKNLVVDGVYGLRVLEGAVYTILQENKKGDLRIPVKTQKRILKFAVVASKTAKKTYPYLKKFDPAYFKMMGFTVIEPWTNIQPLKRLNPYHTDFPTSPNHEKADMEEEKQDKCFNALIGDAGKGIKPCTVSDRCWKVNTQPEQESYLLTHQLLYFLLGQVKGCSKVFESRFKAESFDGGMERFLSISCHAMYPEMLKQEKFAIKKKHLGEIDLYMEQAVVCGMIGYTDFLSIDRLNLILKWRHKDGCFGYTDEIGGKEEDEEGGYGMGSDEGMQTMRKLEVTRDLKGGCEVHSTGVGIGLLALYLRWLLHLTYRQSPSEGSRARAYPHHFNNYSNNLMIMFVVVAAFITMLMIFSKRLGLRLHRNRLIRNLCPCI